MHKLLIVSIILLSVLKTHSQESDFINLIFENKKDLLLTVPVGDTETVDPNKYYLFSKTTKWLPDRFNKVNDSNFSNPKHRLYLMLDKWVDSSFSIAEKNNLLKEIKNSSTSDLRSAYNNICVTKSIDGIINSYIYMLTQPVYTLDSSYALMDLSVFYPNEGDKSIEDGHEAQMLFIFKRIGKDTWVIIKRRTTVLIY